MLDGHPSLPCSSHRFSLQAQAVMPCLRARRVAASASKQSAASEQDAGTAYQRAKVYPGYPQAELVGPSPHHRVNQRFSHVRLFGLRDAGAGFEVGRQCQQLFDMVPVAMGLVATHDIASCRYPGWAAFL